jgi:hypothetical protein
MEQKESRDAVDSVLNKIQADVKNFSDALLGLEQNNYSLHEVMINFSCLIASIADEKMDDLEYNYYDYALRSAISGWRELEELSLGCKQFLDISC